MLSNWPRLRRLLKWTGRGLLLVLVLLVGVYLLRDQLLARPLANLVAHRMSAALGGRFSVERIEGDYFSELVIIGLRTEVEPPAGPLRRLDLDRATVRFSLRQVLKDPIAAIQAIEGAGVVLELDFDRPMPVTDDRGSNGPGFDLADVLPKTFPQIAIEGQVTVRADGRKFSIGKITASGGGDSIDLRVEGLDLPLDVDWDDDCALTTDLVRLRLTQPAFGTFALFSEDALAGVTPRRVTVTVLGPFSAEAELGFAGGTILATFTEEEATLRATGLSVAQLPAEITAQIKRRVPPDTQLPHAGKVDFDVIVLRPLAADREARATITVNRLHWTDWSVELFEVKGAWQNGVVRFETVDARFDNGFIRARHIEFRPALDLPLIRLDLLEADIPDLRIPLRRLGIVKRLPSLPVTFRVRAHRARGAGSAAVTVKLLALTVGPTYVNATGEFTLPGDVERWRESPLRLAVDGVFDARSLPPDFGMAILGAVTVKGRVGGTPAKPTALLDVQGTSLTVDNTPIEKLEAKCRLAWPFVDIDSLSFIAAPGGLTVNGRANLEERSLENGSYVVDISNLAELAKLIPGAPAMKGVIRGSGHIKRLSIDGECEGDADLVCEGLEIEGVVIEAATLKVTMRGDTLSLPEFSVRARTWSVAGAADATIARGTGTVSATVTSLEANALGNTLKLRAPLNLGWDGATATLKDLDATLLGGRIRGSASYGASYGAAITLQIEGTGIDVGQAYEDAQGLLTFKVKAEGTTAAPRWELTISSSGLEFQQQEAKVDVRVRQDDTGIHVDSLRVDGVPKMSLSGSGFIPIEVGVDGVHIVAGVPSLKMSVDVTSGGLARYLPKELSFTKASFETTMNGNVVDGVFRLRKLRWTEAPDHFLEGDTVIRLRARDHGIDLILEGARIGPIIVEGNLHTNARLDWKDPESLIDRIQTAAISGRASLQVTDLAPLVKLPGSPFAHVDGTGTVDVTFSGTPQEPRFQGTVAIQASRMRLHGDLPSLQDVVARLSVTDAGLNIDQFEAQLGYSPLQVTGNVKFPTDAHADLLFDVNVRGKNVLLSRTPYLRLRADLDITAKGPLARLAATGGMTVTNMLWSEPLKLFSNGGAAAANSNLHLFSIRDEPFTNMTFDIAVRANDTLRLDSDVVRGTLSADLNLRGTGAVPRLEGRIDFENLGLSFPITRERLRVERGSLIFSPDDPLRPVINARCEARKLGYDLSVTVTGRVPDVEVHVTSIPALPPEDAILLLTTGTTRERLAESGHMTAGLYIGRSVLDAVMGPSDPDKESVVDRFEFESGKDVSANGDPTMESRFRLAKRYYLTAARDRWGDYNGGLMWRIRFR